MNHYRPTVWLVLLLLAVAACTDTEPRTQVMLEIDADEAVRAELATLRVLISVSDDQGKTWNPRLTETFDEKRVGAWDEFEWPARLGLVPDGDNSERRFNVRVQALDSGDDLYVWQSAVAGFTKGHTTVLRMTLSAACAAMLTSCGDPSCVGTKGCQTCDQGQCEDVALATLKEFDPDEKPRDAGDEVDGDAGDAGVRGDADSGGMDGDKEEGGMKPPPVDAGPDSGEDTGTGQEPEPPKYHVVSSTPDEGDPELDADDDVVQVKLSAEVDPESVTWESFIVTRNGESLDGEFTVGKTTVTFDPDEPWVLGGRYHLELTDAIEDADGKPLDPFELDFRFHDGEWSKAGFGSAVVDARLAGAPGGDAVLAMGHNGNSGYDISAQRFLAPSTWEAETPLGGGFASLNLTAINDKHHPAVSMQSISGHFVCQTLVTGSTWQDCGYIMNGGGDPSWFLSSNDELYVATSVFGIMDTTGNVLRGLDFTLGAVSPTEFNIANDTGDNQDASLAMLDGAARVVWRKRTDGSSPYQIMAGPHNTNTFKVISSDSAVDVMGPQLVSNQAQSSAIAVWEQVDMTWNNVWAARIAAGGTWSDAVRVSDNESSAQNPKIAMDNQGRALVVWKQSGAIVGAGYVPGDGWSEPETIADDPVTIDPAQVALEPGGNGFAAWVQDGRVSSSNEVWVARYLAGKGWQTPQRVSGLSAGTGEGISLAIDNRGRAFLVWVEANQAWVARFE